MNTHLNEIAYIILVRHLHEYFNFQWINMGGPRGGTGGPDPPWIKSQKYRVSKQYWSGSPEKSQGYKANIHGWAIIGTPAKRRFAGGTMMARLSWYLDPLSPNQLKCL